MQDDKTEATPAATNVVPDAAATNITSSQGAYIICTCYNIIMSLYSQCVHMHSIFMGILWTYSIFFCKLDGLIYYNEFVKFG